MRKDIFYDVDYKYLLRIDIILQNIKLKYI
jgi:hypothetical protein